MPNFFYNSFFKLEIPELKMTSSSAWFCSVVFFCDNLSVVELEKNGPKLKKDFSSEK